MDHEKRNLNTAPLLQAPRAQYEAAVQSLQQRSPYYKGVEIRGERLVSEDGDPVLLDCALETDGGSALARRLSQTGPAEGKMRVNLMMKKCVMSQKVRWRMQVPWASSQ